MSEADLVARATQSIRAGSKSFATASRLFDGPTRAGAVMLYAWCRHCDDVVDGQEMGHARPGSALGTAGARLDDLRRQTVAALAGEPAGDPVFAAFQEVMARHAIPPHLALAHLDGFAMDVAGTRYRTLDDTLVYCYRVAGVVGLMMAHVMGVQDEAVFDRACDLGLAFQLTNIARDIVEDARAGRVYLPEAWLAEAGIPPGEVAEPAHRGRLTMVAARLVSAADPYYASALAGIPALPPRSAWAIATAHRIYRAIGIEVVRRGPAAWDRRVSTTRPQKLGLLLRGAGTALAAPHFTRLRASPSRQGLWARPATVSADSARADSRQEGSRHHGR